MTKPSNGAQLSQFVTADLLSPLLSSLTLSRPLPPSPTNHQPSTTTTTATTNDNDNHNDNKTTTTKPHKPHQTAPHRTKPNLTKPHHTSPHQTSPHLTTPHHTTPHHTTPHLTTPHITHHTSQHTTTTRRLVQTVAHQWRPKVSCVPNPSGGHGWRTRQRRCAAPWGAPPTCMAAACAYGGAAGSCGEAPPQREQGGAGQRPTGRQENRAGMEEAGLRTHSGLRAPTLLPPGTRPEPLEEPLHCFTEGLEAVFSVDGAPSLSLPVLADRAAQVVDATCLAFLVRCAVEDRKKEEEEVEAEKKEKAKAEVSRSLMRLFQASSSSSSPRKRKKRRKRKTPKTSSSARVGVQVRRCGQGLRRSLLSGARVSTACRAARFGMRIRRCGHGFVLCST